MTSIRRLLIIGDVGGEKARHIGDEAMLEANLEAFRRLIPGVSFILVSRDPEWTAARYDVEAVAPFGFLGDVSAAVERETLLERLLEDARQPAEGSATRDSIQSPGRRTSAALADSDGLVLSGGGNLSSTWPDLLYERIALLLLAQMFEKPSVILGQTLGPGLRTRERILLGEALRSARFLGVREVQSAMLALELEVKQERIWYQNDDALFPGESPESIPFSSSVRPAQIGNISVTIDPQIRATSELVFDSLVSQLRELSQTTEAPLVIVPHAFGEEPDSVPSDLTESRLLAERINLSNVVVAPGFDARQARDATSAATLIISSRYHPIVFGLAAAVPSIGIYGDDYCRIKLQGALAHAKLEHLTLTYSDVAEGKLLQKALELWRSRNDVSRQIESYYPVWREEIRARWVEILRALDPALTLRPSTTDTIFGRPLAEVAPAILSAQEGRDRWSASEMPALERLPARSDANDPGIKNVSGWWSVVRSKLRRV
jgi:polysaccharide pyruvyl transferase WcaK-like protein